MKNNNILLTILVVLLLISIGTSGYLIYDNYIISKGNTEEENSDNNINSDENEIMFTIKIHRNEFTKTNEILFVNTKGDLILRQNGKDYNYTSDINSKVIDGFAIWDCSARFNVFIVTEDGSLYYNKNNLFSLNNFNTKLPFIKSSVKEKVIGLTYTDNSEGYCWGKNIPLFAILNDMTTKQIYVDCSDDDSIIKEISLEDKYTSDCSVK